MPNAASPKVGQQFDYSSLDAVTSLFVQNQTREIRALMKRTAQGIVEIGLKLIEVKQRLGHGYFGGWLEAEFEWSQDTATNFMRVAQRFGNNPKISEFAPSALYLFAAPSTPEPALEEALARVEAGESITHKTAVTIKQKYTSRVTKPQPKLESELPTAPISPPQQTPTSAPLSQSAFKKPEIIAIRPPTQAVSVATDNQVINPQITHSATVPPAASSVSAPDVPGVWWRLGQHLLYCGDPNSPEFTFRVQEKVRLLLAFPSTADWQPVIQAQTRFISENLSIAKDERFFEDTLESILLLCSKVSDIVAGCFLPSIEILYIINRQDRRGVFAEPDERRVNAIIADWKKAGLKVERVS